MIAYSEVKEVLHTNLKMLVMRLEDDDIECRTHARQLCKEGLQEHAYSLTELKAHLNEVSSSSRDFLMNLLYEEMGEMESTQSAPIVEEPMEEISQPETIPSLLDYVDIQLDDVFSPLQPLRERIRFIPSSVAHELYPAPTILGQAIKQLQQFDSILRLMHTSSSFVLFYSEERDQTMQSLHTIASWIQDVLLILNCK